MQTTTIVEKLLAHLKSDRGRYTVVGIVALVVAVSAVRTANGIMQGRIPDFSQYEAGEVRKNAFFDYLLPRVRESNNEIRETRQELLSLREEKDSLSGRQHRKVERVASEYEVDEFDVSSDSDWDVLLRRVDVVPPSLALAQAANESAWGTSRFASEGRNFFGHWCYEPGCGMVPRQRPEDAIYEVADFKSAQQSVDRYIHNLNHHPAYRELRLIRENLRKQNGTLSGMALAAGLENYSERGNEYVDMIRTIISANDLVTFDPRA